MSTTTEAQLMAECCVYDNKRLTKAYHHPECGVLLDTKRTGCYKKTVLVTTVAQAIGTGKVKCVSSCCSSKLADPVVVKGG